jgi:surface carbohydrate biosynthesis protein
MAFLTLIMTNGLKLKKLKVGITLFRHPNLKFLLESSVPRMICKLLKLVKFIWVRIQGSYAITRPPKVDIVILDESGAEWLTGLFRGREYVIVGNPGRIWYLSRAAIGLFFKWFFKTSHPAEAYAIAVIKCIEPKIVISIIDNSRLFYEVSRHSNGPRFLAIQNANRVDTVFLSSEEAKKIYIPEYACYGEYERDLYQSRGAKVGKFYPIGSLRDDIYRRQHRVLGAAQEYDVCVVSEGGPGADKVWFPGIERSMILILEHAVRFCEERKLRLCIAGKRADSLSYDAEKAWIVKNLGRDIEVIRPVRYEFTTWKLIDRSAVAVAQCSTALREGMGRGNRVLFCNYSKNSKLDFHNEGLWFLKDPTYQAFEQRMVKLLSMSDEEFKAKAAITSQYIVNYNIDNPTSEFLEKLIADAVAD